jgi:uncharacterized protein
MLSDELAKLRDLHREGELSDDEYIAAKAQLLKSPSAKIEWNPPDRVALFGMTPDNYSALLHLSHYAGFAFPVAGFIIPIGLWLYGRKESDVVDAHGKSSAQFLVSYFIYMVVLWMLSGPLIAFNLFSLRMLGTIFDELAVGNFPYSLMPILAILIAVFSIFTLIGLVAMIAPICGAMAATQGKAFRYPLTLKLF